MNAKTRLLVGAWLLAGSVSVLSQSVIIWDGLLTPVTTQPAQGVLLSQGTAVGFQLTPSAPLRLETLTGFIGMPAPVVVGPNAPSLPQISLSLWDGGVAAGIEPVSLAGYGLLPPSYVTQSQLRVWGLWGDLGSIPWVLQPGHTYVVAVSMSSPIEWLVHNPVTESSVVSTGIDWDTLPTPPLGWNARLTGLPVPVPEPAWAGLASGLALLGLALRRHFASTPSR